ncbi:histone-lysine N-methyltransferase 2B-like isoform X1 [Scylla paramamosain]|uniref:histone-lysine N-methyltransferase 2B-like isoform X1 n=2 Tax=Scylla paramamosain TaxID=85552 RepID=UPI0030826F88
METEYSGGGGGCGGGDGEKKRRQHCTYCKNHGEHSRKTNHKCKYENCDCLLCKLTRLSRLIMRHQQRLWRHLKDTRRREDAAEAAAGGDSVPYGGAGIPTSTKQQKCDMCRNHGKITEKRAHKNACPFQNCRCALCDLTMKRRNIMRHQQRVRRSQVTSKQHNEAYEYVTQTTEELAQLSDSLRDTSISTTSTTTTPSTPPNPTTPISHPTPATPQAPPIVVPSVSSVSPPSSLSPSPLYSITPTSTTTSPSYKDVQPVESLEKGGYVPCMPRSLVVPEPRGWPPMDPFLHYETEPPTLDAVGFQPLGGANRNLKREREEMPTCAPAHFGDTNLFRDLDFMRGSTLIARDNCVRSMNLHAYDSMTNILDIGAYRDPAFQTPPPLLPPTTAPQKKSRFMLSSEDLHMSYRRGFWGGAQAEAGFAPRDDLPLPYRRLTPSESADVRMRSPPALIPLPQTQPIRPQPVSPLRPPGLHPGMEWDPVTLPCLAYSLLHTRTYTRALPPPHFSLSQVTPLLHPSVP